MDLECLGWGWVGFLSEVDMEEFHDYLKCKQYYEESLLKPLHVLILYSLEINSLKDFITKYKEFKNYTNI